MGKKGGRSGRGVERRGRGWQVRRARECMARGRRRGCMGHKRREKLAWKEGRGEDAVIRKGRIHY